MNLYLKILTDLYKRGKLVLIKKNVINSLKFLHCKSLSYASSIQIYVNAPYLSGTVFGLGETIAQVSLLSQTKNLGEMAQAQFRTLLEKSKATVSDTFSMCQT